MKSQIRPAVMMLVALTLITGLAYPLAVTGLAQLLFPHQANGSLISAGGVTKGSELIGQPFGDPRYFWGRPSATAPVPYNGAASGGSNLGPLNPALVQAVQARVAALRAADPSNTSLIPVDLVTASGSGLDPDISLTAAEYQVARVARARGLTVDAIKQLVIKASVGRQLGILGEPRVNVLELNLALDALR